MKNSVKKFVNKPAKKALITLTAAILCSTMSVYAQETVSSVPVVPVACPVQGAPCEKHQPCNCGKPECPNCNQAAPVFNSCEEIQKWKLKFFEIRGCLYDKLCLTQEQRVKAKCIDEKFFDEIAPLKMCCKQEKAKLEDMKCKKCSWSDKREQKQKIKDLKEEIKDKKKQHKECFMQILTCAQKDKYKALMKNKCKKHKKPKCECGCQ